MSETSQLISGARQLGVELPPDAAESMVQYLDHFYSWNDYAGFTSIARNDALRLHLLDSLSIAPELGPARSIVDLGSGGGMPGIPLALALPDAHVALVESKRRRCSFLREAVRELRLDARVAIREADATKVVLGAPASDAVVARAFLPPGDLLALANQLLQPGGVVVIMAGGAGLSVPRVLDHPAFELFCERSLRLPGGKEERRIVVARRRHCFT